MPDDDERLADVVSAIEARLPAWGFGDDKVAWLRERRAAFADGTRPLDDLRAELRAICGGMGSLTDHVIRDPALSAERDRLTAELFRLTSD